MSQRRYSLLAVTLLTVLFAVPQGLAQKSKKADSGQDPSEKPRNVKPELKKAYKDWNPMRSRAILPAARMNASRMKAAALHRHIHLSAGSTATCPGSARA